MSPVPDSSPFDLSALRSNGSRRAVVDMGGEWSAAETVANAEAVAGALTDRHGLKPGAAVGLDLPGGRLWAAAAAGAWLAGLAIRPVSPHWPSVRRGTALAACEFVADRAAVEAMIADMAEAEQRPLEDSLPAVLLETSGSSGPPKLITHSRASAAAHALNAAVAVQLEADDEWLAPLPACHAGGVGAVLRCLQAGAAIDFREGCTLDQLFQQLSGPSSSASIVSLVPTQLRRLLAAGWAPAPRLTRVIVGGGSIDDRLIELALEAGVPIRPSWGMTEALGMISVSSGAAEEQARRAGSGRPIPGLEVKADLEDGVGRLKIRGASVAPGLAGRDGWFDTGDAGFVRDGYVYVDGRVGGMIVTGGENVAPDRVAAGLVAVPGVLDAMVYGEPDEEWGQRVAAAVQISPGAQLDEEALRTALAATLSRWEIPKRIEFVEQIERNPMGKATEPR